MTNLTATVETMLEQGLRNGMSFKQLRERVPGLAAKKLGISEADFHQQLEGMTDNSMDAMCNRIAAKFTPAQRVEIGARR